MQYVKSVCVGDLPRKMNILDFLDWIPQLISLSLLKVSPFCFLFSLHFSERSPTDSFVYVPSFQSSPHAASYL